MRLNRLNRILILILPILFISSILNDTDIEELLKKISSSYRNFKFKQKLNSYYYRNGEISSEREIEIINNAPDSTLIFNKRKDSQKSYKRLRTPDYIIYEEEDKYSKVYRNPYSGSVFLNEELLKLMQQNYMFKPRKGEKIFDRETINLTIKSTENYKPWVKLWICEKTGIIFRKEEYNSKNKLVFSYNTSEFELNPDINVTLFYIPLDKIQVSRRYTYYDGIDELEKNVGFPVGSLDGVLEEYKPLKIGSTVTRKGQKRSYIWYTDGYSTISLFQRKASKDDKDKEKEIVVRRRHSDTGLQKVESGYYFLMVGDISEEVLINAFKTVLEQFKNNPDK